MLRRNPPRPNPSPETPPRSRRVAMGLALAALASAAGWGCAGLNLRPPAPSVKVVGARFGDLSTEGLTLLLDADIANPYAADLPLVELGYGLSSGGARFLDGKAPLSGAVPARSSRTVELPVKVSFAPLLRAAKGVRPGGVVPYSAELTMTFRGLGLEHPASFSKSGELPIPAAPGVSVRAFKFDAMGLRKTTAILAVDITNTNSFPVDLSRLAVGLDLAGTPVSSAQLAAPLSLKPGETGTLSLPLEISMAKLGFSALSALKGKDAPYKITGETALGTPFGPITLPFEQSGSTKVAH